MSLFNILVDIAARTADFESGIDKVNKKLDDFKEGVKRAFEVAADGAVAEFTKKIIEMGDALNDAKTKAGVTSEAFTQLAYAAKLSNVDVTSLSQAILKMNVAISNAATGGKAQTEALAALGLTYKQIKDLAPEDQFTIIADRISKLGTSADKSRVEVALFGKAGGDLAGLFEGGAAGILKMRQEAQQLGQSFSDEQLKVFEEAHQSIDRLEASFSALALTLVGKAAPALTGILDTLSSIVSQDAMLKTKVAIDFLQRQADSNASYFSTGGDYGSFGVHSGSTALDQANRLRAQLATSQLAIDPNKLKLNDSGLLDGISPGYLPNPNDILQPFHTTLTKQSAGGGKVNPAVQGYLDDTAALQEAGGKASDEFNKTQAELKGALDDGALSLDDFNARMKAARDKFNDAIDIQPLVVSLQKLPTLLTEADHRSLDFIDDVQSGFLQASQASGAFGQNLLKSLLQAFENRAIFNAIDEIGSALKKALDVGGAGGGGSWLGGLISAVIGGSFGEGDIGAGADSTATDFIDTYNSTYGGHMAQGGPLQMGKWYTAGEHGPEPVWGGGPGAFASGYGGGGGGVVVNAPTTVDARGASTDLVKALPSILKANNDALEAKIVMGLQRRKYSV